jgi:hypothetical protein
MNQEQQHAITYLREESCKTLPQCRHLYFFGCKLDRPPIRGSPDYREAFVPPVYWEPSIPGIAQYLSPEMTTEATESNSLPQTG